MSPSERPDAALERMTADRDKWKRTSRMHEERAKARRAALAPIMRELARYVVLELRAARYIEIHTDNPHDNRKDNT